jgi:hypothetical protein
VNWEPIGREALLSLMAAELAESDPEQRASFSEVAVPPVKWQLSPWGDPGGGFWIVATKDDRVLWYNDIEDGFNVSHFVVPGTIPSSEYWCNQDKLPWALPTLVGRAGATA